MAKTFPKKLFVRIDKDSQTEYFTADADADCLVEMGDKKKIAVYQLVEVQVAEGVAKFSKSRR